MARNGPFKSAFFATIKIFPLSKFQSLQLLYFGSFSPSNFPVLPLSHYSRSCFLTPDHTLLPRVNIMQAQWANTWLMSRLPSLGSPYHVDWVSKHSMPKGDSMPIYHCVALNVIRSLAYSFFCSDTRHLLHLRCCFMLLKYIRKQNARISSPCGA